MMARDNKKDALSSRREATLLKSNGSNPLGVKVKLIEQKGKYSYQKTCC
jgi:hypothetical protein